MMHGGSQLGGQIHLPNGGTDKQCIQPGQKITSAPDQSCRPITQEDVQKLQEHQETTNVSHILMIPGPECQIK